MQVIDSCEQLTDEWYALKLGMVSASNFGKVMNKGSGRGLYMRRLAAERLTGETQATYSNDNMEAGSELEDEAREYYAALNACAVKQVAFVKRDDCVGCSPDGLVGEDGLVEIKCVLPSTHIDYITRDKMPAIYKWQVQGQLWVCERKYCDFVSYCPAIRSRPFYCCRIFRDEAYIKELAIQVIIFVGELKEMIKKMTTSEF